MTIARRKFLKTSGGALAGILANGRAPAYAQGTTLHWLRLGDFVPASDTLLRQELLPQAEKALGFKITFETINGNDLQARITSAIQAGTGADIVHAMHNWPHLYAESLADVSDVAEEIGSQQGGFYEIFPAVAKSERGWLAVPWCALGILLCYRKSWFDEIGAVKFPDSWEEYRRAGKLLKTKGRHIGQTLGHTYNDAPAFTYPYLWSWGGKEVEADGRTAALDSRETLESVKFIVGFWKDAHDEGGLAWDDSSNNRAFISGSICATSNAASIYIEALRKPDQYLTEKGTPLKDDILHAPYPKGTAGVATLHPPQTHMLMGYSKNQKAAKEFLRWLSSRPVFEKWFVSQKGFSIPAACVVDTSALERGSGDGAVQGRDPHRAGARLAGPVEPQGCRGDIEIHHHRHVRKSGAGHARRGRGEMGARGAGEDLRVRVARNQGITAPGEAERRSIASSRSWCNRWSGRN
jgi:multiple sugar transport system substrate-binding protein